jgi:translocation and assembly module TamB
MLARLVRLVVVLALGLVAVLAAAFGFVQTGFAKSRLETMLERSLAGESGSAEVQGLAGLLPFSVRLERLRLADAEGTWLEVDEARLDLAPGALLTGKVEVREAGAARIALHRLPPGSEEPAPTTGLPELPALPESLPPIRLDRLALPRVELGAPLLGRAAVLAAEGRAGVEPDGRRASASLTLRRIDEPTAELDLEASLDLAGRALALRLEGSERGGLVAAASGLERAGAARLRLVGEGPLAGFRASLEAVLERVGAIEGKLALDLEGLPGVELDLAGRLEPEGAPKGLLEALGERPELALALRPEAAERVRLERLRVATPALSASGEGTVDLAARTLAGRLEAEAPDLARLAGLAGTPLAGSARLALEAAGSPDVPELDLRLEGNGLRAGGFTADRLQLGLATRPLEGEPTALVLGLEGGAEGVVLDGRPLGEGGLVQLAGEAVRRPGGPLQIAGFDLALPGLEMRTAGELDPIALVGELRLEARSFDLAPLAPLFGPGVRLPTGAILAGADLKLAGPGSLEAALQFGADQLGNLPPGLSELLGPGPSGVAKIALAESRTLALEALDLRGAGGRLTGTASLDLARETLGGALRLELPDLSLLSGLAGETLAGSGRLLVEPQGTLARPRLSLSAELDRPAFGPRRLDALEAKAEAALAPAGGELRLDATARLAGDSLVLAGAGRFAGQRLELDAAKLEGLGLALALDGKASLDLERQLVSGHVTGRAADLARLAPLALQDLSGSVELDLRATAEGGRQDLAIRASASRLGGGFGNLAAARLDLAGRDLRGVGSLRGEAALEGLATPDLVLDAAKLTLDGPLAELGFALEATGSQAGQKLALEARGRLAALAEPRRLELAQLTGTLAGQAIRLRQPARITLDKGVLDLGTLDLEIGRATARIRAGLGGPTLRAEATLDDLPLETLAPLGLPRLPGAASGSLRLGGPARAPEGRLELRLVGLGGKDAPPAELRAEARLEGGRRIVVGVRSEGLGPEPLRLTARLPVLVDLEAGRIEPLAEGTLDGSLRGRIELARVGALLPLDGQRLAGPLELDVELAGQPGAPRLSGRARLAGGEVSDAATGFRLRAIEAVATADGPRLVLERLEARDRREGRLTGSGRYDFVGGGLVLDLDLASFQAFAGEFGEATLTGKIGARSAGPALDLKARLEVERAELRLPDPPPAVPATIPVEEVGDGARSSPEPAAGPPLPIRLDLRIDADQRFFVRGRGLESEWYGRIRATGTLDEPDVVGRLELRRGHLDLLGTRFALEQGVVDFDGARPPLPRLDVLGTARKADIVARVGLRGRLPNFALTLESEPPLPQEEVLSRVLFGREMARITPLQGALLANSIATLQGGGIDALSPIRRAAGLDTLDLGGDADTGGALRAGKYLSERVYVEMQRGITPESGRARVEVDLGNNVRGTTEVRETNRTGFGLEWRYDY